MNNGDFFVMLTTQDGGIAPLEDPTNDDILATFETIEAALDAGHNNLLGDMFGFEVFERGYGTTL